MYGYINNNRPTAALTVGLLVAAVVHMSLRKSNKQRQAVGMAPYHPAYLRIIIATSAVAYGLLYLWSQPATAACGRGLQHGGGRTEMPDLIPIEELMGHIDMGDPTF
jgi:hypothetical protein